MRARVHELLLQRALLQPDQWERARDNPVGQPPLEYAVRQGWCDDESDGPPRPGESLELVVRLDAGYHAGDLLQVFLPPALAWLHGGAQTRGFALDFEGRDVLRVPLVVTAATVDAAGRCVPQRCGVYLRNMYDERRGSAFDALTLVVPSAGTAWEGGPGVLEQRLGPQGRAPRA